MPVFDHFDFIAPHYDRMAGVKQVERLVEVARLPVAGRLLDAGGGTGRVAQALRGYVGGAVVADVSAGMLRQARLKPGVQAAFGQAERLPFADDTFERVIMIDALHHVINQAETAGDLWRVLKPGGRIVIQEPDIRTFGVKVIALAEKLLLMRSHFLAPDAIQALFGYPQARTQIILERYLAWVVVDKAGAA